ncbi:hypothetical protein GG344DRAFT_68003 [Lentinula edodes]|nr:hypothetical protein GG344DRAFT_68003 [Lentinula edodes]
MLLVPAFFRVLAMALGISLLSIVSALPNRRTVIHVTFDPGNAYEGTQCEQEQRVEEYLKKNFEGEISWTNRYSSAQDPSHARIRIRTDMGVLEMFAIAIVDTTEFKGGNALGVSKVTNNAEDGDFNELLKTFKQKYPASAAGRM